MRKIILAAAAAGAALTLAACSEGTEENAEATMDSMAADADANMDAVEATAEDAAMDAEMAADSAVEATDGDQTRGDLASELEFKRSLHAFCNCEGRREVGGCFSAGRFWGEGSATWTEVRQRPVTRMSRSKRFGLCG